jgi:hypothetical protein
MTGLIWFVQIVHYPLFASAAPQAFPVYGIQHTKLTGRIVGPVMCVEALAAIALVWMYPRGIIVWLGLGLLVIIWLSTFLLQVPQHKRLSLGFDAGAHRALVRSNWIRTIAWSLRGLLSLWMMKTLFAI